MSWQQWILIAILVASAMATTHEVGKTPEPTSHAVAVIVILITALLVWLVVSIPVA